MCGCTAYCSLDGSRPGRVNHPANHSRCAPRGPRRDRSHRVPEDRAPTTCGARSEDSPADPVLAQPQPLCDSRPPPPQPGQATLEHKICVLIDFENIAAGTEKEGLGRFDIRVVLRRLKDKGRILVNRSYGDWGRYAKFKQRLLEQGVTMVELTSYRGQDKNRADIALVVDAMEIAFTRDYITTFVLMSGDSDFTPVVMRLKELDKRVIGIGTKGSSSRLLVDSCDEFIFYESLLKQHRATTDDRSRDNRRNQRSATPAPAGAAEVQASAPAPDDSSETLSKQGAFELLAETLSNIQKDDPGPVLGGLVKQSMLRKEPSFDETEYGYSGFARFLEAARGRNLVKLTRDEKAGGYRVDSPSPEAEDTTESVRAKAAPSPEASESSPVSVPKHRGRAGKLHSILSEAGFDPITHMARHTVVHELVDHVQERERRRKRNTLQYVYGDISRRCRKTDPYVDAEQVKSVIDAVKAAGLMLHSSGGPVRSQSAHFILRADAEEILVTLRRFYIHTLLDAEADLSHSKSLSEILWNDQDHAVEAEELVAWILHERSLEEEVPAAEDESPIYDEE